MELEIHNIEGKPTGKKVKLSDDVFGIEPNDHVIYLDVKRYLAAQRQGTHKTKERGEVKGSTRKIKKQKGTGTARAGDIKNPMFKGGGTAFGPRPRNHRIKLNHKETQLARKSALSYKVRDNQIYVLEDIKFDAPSTKNLNQILVNLETSGKKILFVTGGLDTNLYLSGRNIQKFNFANPKSLNTYEILNSDKVILTEKAVEMITENFKK